MNPSPPDQRQQSLAKLRERAKRLARFADLAAPPTLMRREVELIQRAMAELGAEPEPSDAEIEAAAKALWESETHLMGWENLPENTHDRWNTVRQAKAVLLAARQARAQAGDERTP